MTVSNQKRAIATRGTMHKATTFAPSDVCLDPASGTTVPGVNYIYTKNKLDPGTNSQRTFIKRFRIWIDGGAVGKPGGTDSLPPHPPHVIGVRTQVPYLKAAWNSTCSRDVLVEARGVVRTGDFTHQNLRNTTGTVDGSELEPDRDPTEEYFANACKIMKLEGKSSGKEGHALYKKSKKAKKSDYLHVFEGDTIDLEVERWDTTAKPGGVVTTCALTPDHAHWTATRTGGGFEEMEETGTGDTFTVPATLTDLGMDLPSSVSLTAKAGPVSVEWSQLVKFWRAQQSPAEINVRALSCGGGQTANIVVKPKGDVTFKIAFEKETPEGGSPNERAIGDNNTARTLFLCLAMLKPPLAVLKAVSNISSNIKFDYSFLDGVSIEFKMGYKRCTEDTTRRGDSFTKAHIRPNWSIALELDPLVKVSLAGNIALVDVVQVWLPGAGSAIAKLLKRINLSLAKLELKLELAAGVGGEFACDQDNKLDSSQFIYGKVTLTLSLTLTIELSVIEASLGASVVGELKVGVGPPKVKDTLLQTHFKGEVRTEIKLSGKIWIYEASATYKGPKFSPPEKVWNLPAPS